VGLSNLLKLGLDFANSLVLELFNFFERAANHAECLGIDASRGENLVRLGIFRLQALLDGLKLLLKNEIAETSLAVNVVNDSVELLEQLFLLLLNVLVLLEADFVLPLEVLVLLLSFDDSALLVGQLLAHLVVFMLLLREACDILFHLLQRLHDLVVVGVLELLLAVGICLLDLLRLEVGAQRADHVHIEARDFVVVAVNVLVLLVVLCLKLLNGAVLLGLDLGDLRLSLGLHIES